MPVDTEAKRRAALRVPGVLPPADGTIDAVDRAATVAQYWVDPSGLATGLVTQIDVNIDTQDEIVCY